MLQIDIKKQLGKNGSNGFRLDISFTVENGITVLAGPSGAGKTTTLNLIAGVLKPDEGIISAGEQVYFDAANKIDLTMQKRRVGFVFQDYALFPNLTAEQNIAYGIKAAAKKKKTLELLELFRIPHLAGRYPHEMSGGEQQRVAIARALASDPAIVLMDEPLSAVDVETRAKLLDEIETAQRSANIPFIYVTHNLAEAERLGAQRITLEGGRVV